MKLFNNKFFIVALCVAVVLCAVPSTFALMGYQGLAKNIVGTVTAPFRWCATVITDAFEGFGRYFTSVDALYEKNAELESQNRELEDRLDRAEILEQENERLRKYLEMKQKYPSFTFEEGMVIGYSAGSHVTGFTLNKGSIHGIAVNMPVVTDVGIVGYVREVGLNWCTVSTLIDAESSVGAYIPRTGESGIVSGDHALRQDGFCKISYMNSEADVQVGDKVYSNGTGSIYPAELAVGEVIDVSLDEYSREVVATVKPSVDFSNLRWMMIITGYGE